MCVPAIDIKMTLRQLLQEEKPNAHDQKNKTEGRGEMETKFCCSIFVLDM